LRYRQKSNAEFVKLFFKVFSKRSPSNHRDHVDDVVLLLTDGAPNPIVKQTSKADEYAKILKSRNVTIIGLAIGNATIVRDFKPNIEEWATSPELVFEAEIENLQKITNELVDASCNTPDAGNFLMSDLLVYILNNFHHRLFFEKSNKIPRFDRKIL
jgi:hypothetical protein